jgi:hypothetical protein
MLMRSIFVAKPKATPVPVATSEEPPVVLPAAADMVLSPADLVDYLSDCSNDSVESADGGDADNEEDREEDREPIPTETMSSHRLPAVPPRKRRRLDVPAREMRKRKKAEQMTELQMPTLRS